MTDLDQVSSRVQSKQASLEVRGQRETSGIIQDGFRKVVGLKLEHSHSPLLSPFLSLVVHVSHVPYKLSLKLRKGKVIPD